jgi:hypothetical protein
MRLVIVNNQDQSTPGQINLNAPRKVIEIDRDHAVSAGPATPRDIREQRLMRSSVML